MGTSCEIVEPVHVPVAVPTTSNQVPFMLTTEINGEIVFSLVMCLLTQPSRVKPRLLLERF
jgi:hypothetical protein